MPAGWRLSTALLVACVGLLGVAATAEAPFSLPPGVPILVTAAVVSALLRNRAGILVGLVAAAVVTVATFRPGLASELGGDLGLARAASRWLELAGLAAAIVIAVAALRSQGPVRAGPVGGDGIDQSAVQRGRLGSRRDHPGPAGQVVGLLVLCGVGAELLSAYSDTTGDPGGVAFSLVFFAALYGAPALLVRELARRRGWGWPSMLLAFAALGVAQACLIDQSMFSVDYQAYEGWEETRAATLVPGLGISAFNAFNFVVGHMIFSFAAPVALVEAWHPERAHEPWLTAARPGPGRPGVPGRRGAHPVRPDVPFRHSGPADGVRARGAGTDRPRRPGRPESLKDPPRAGTQTEPA